MTQAIEVRTAAVGFYFICSFKDGRRYVSGKRLSTREDAFATATAYYEANKDGLNKIVDVKSVTTDSSVVVKPATAKATTKVVSKGKRIDPVTGRSLNKDGSVRAVRGSKTHK